MRHNQECRVGKRAVMARRIVSSEPGSRDEVVSSRIRDARAMKQRPRNSDPLALPVREVGSAGLDAHLRVNRGSRPDILSAPRAAGRAPGRPRSIRIFRCAGSRQSTGERESAGPQDSKPMIAGSPASPRECLCRRSRSRPIERRRAAPGVCRRAFARAVRTHDGDPLALREFQASESE